MHPEPRPDPARGLERSAFHHRHPGIAAPRLTAALLALCLATSAQAQDHSPFTLRLLARSAAGTIDPQVNYTAQYWQILATTHDGLLAFRKAEGPAGTQLVPDLAAALPEQDGLRYRFRLRPGLRFSNGRPVRPEDVVASFRRVFRIGGPTAETFFGAIQGAEACLRTPSTCTLEGVQSEADTVTITLSRPDPEFLQKLALPHAAILPADAPDHDAGTTPIPGTGPYRITSYDPNTGLLLERNPFFTPWSPEAQPPAVPDAVRYEFGLDAEAATTAVLSGTADWMFDTPPPDRLPEIGAHPDQVHINPADAIWFVALNTRIPPFDDPAIRRALNLAVDRRAPVRLFGGSRLAAPLCQAIPPGLPGHEPYCPYPHDPAQARALVATSRHPGAPVTLVVDDGPVSVAIGTYLLDVLSDIGLHPRLQPLSANIQFTYIQNTANRVQASLTSWYADYPSANNILSGNFGCAAFHPNSDSSTNIPGFCHPALDHQLAQALLTQDWPEVAAVDRAVTDAAPAAILFTPRYIDLLSPRMANVVYHPTFHWLFQLAHPR